MAFHIKPIFLYQAAICIVIGQLEPGQLKMEVSYIQESAFLKDCDPAILKLIENCLLNCNGRIS